MTRYLHPCAILTALASVLISSSCQFKWESQKSDEKTLFDKNMHLTSRIIPVCFDENTTRNYPQAKNQVQAIVQAEFARVGLKFVGWQGCSSYAGKSVPQLIQVLNAKKADVLSANCGGGYTWQFLNKTFNGEGTKIYLMLDCYRTKGQKENLDSAFQCTWDYLNQPDMVQNMDRVTLHEFGHALGMQHEEDRKKLMSNPTINACGQEDRSSVMHVDNENGHLSSLDVSCLSQKFQAVPEIWPPGFNGSNVPANPPSSSPSSPHSSLTGDGCKRVMSRLLLKFI